MTTIEKRREYGRKYRKKNKDKLNSQARLRYSKNLESERENQRLWRSAHKEQERQRWKAYYASHRDERNAIQKERRVWDKEKYKIKRREWYKAHKDELQEKMRNDRIALRNEILRRYGGKCSCCGETEPKFLAIDHIDGGGYAHRKKIGQDGHSLYHWIRKNNYPPIFQILCHNCNMAKGLYGECPHKRGERRD